MYTLLTVIVLFSLFYVAPNIHMFTVALKTLKTWFQMNEVFLYNERCPDQVFLAPKTYIHIHDFVSNNQS